MGSPEAEKSVSRPRTRIVQVSNISPTATREQIYTLFSYLGKIEETKIYPSETNPGFSSMTQKLAYIRFDSSDSVASCQHMTNTVFIDRAIICLPIYGDNIPDEEGALKSGGPSWPGQRQLPPSVVNQLQMLGDTQVIQTIDPTLSGLGLPPYPPLPANTDASKIEEIRRTIYVANISKEAEPEELMGFFNAYIGEVMYLRMAGTSSLSTNYCYVEFSNQSTVPTALQNNGIELRGMALKIVHSRVSIIKPSRKTDAMAQKEVEDAAAKDPSAGGLGTQTTTTLSRGLERSGVTKGSRSRSPTPSWRRGARRSRSNSRSTRRRSRSRSRRSRKRSTSRSRPSRDARKRSRSRKRSKSTSRSRRHRSKSRDKGKKDGDRKSDGNRRRESGSAKERFKGEKKTDDKRKAEARKEEVKRIKQESEVTEVHADAPVTIKEEKVDMAEPPVEEEDLVEDVDAKLERLRKELEVKKQQSTESPKSKPVKQEKVSESDQSQDDTKIKKVRKSSERHIRKRKSRSPSYKKRRRSRSKDRDYKGKEVEDRYKDRKKGRERRKKRSKRQSSSEDSSDQVVQRARQRALAAKVKREGDSKKEKSSSESSASD